MLSFATIELDADDLGPWWLFLMTGVLWLIFSFVILSFNWVTVWSVAVLAGLVFWVGAAALARGITSIFLAFRVKGAQDRLAAAGARRLSGRSCRVEHAHPVRLARVSSTVSHHFRPDTPAPAKKNVSRMPAGNAPQKPICVRPRLPRKSIRSHVAGNEAITAAMTMRTNAII